MTALAAAIAIVLSAGTAVAAPGRADPDDEIPRPPPTYKGGSVNVEERLGARVPLDARFRTLDGAVTTLGDVLRGELPTILTFNYADCPMLCSLQLNGLMAALPAVAERGPAPAGAAPTGAPVSEANTSVQPSVSRGDRSGAPGLWPGAPAGDTVAFRAGAQFRIVTISLEPHESLERLSRMRDRYLARLPEAEREAVRAGWTLLVAEAPGEAASIRRVAEAVGFSYVYVTERGEWAHPAALIFLSTTGAVTRYVHGIEFPPAMLRESIFKAGLAEPATAVGFLNRCYHYDPAASDRSGVAVVALRLGAAGFVVLLLAGLGALHLVRRARARPPSPHPRSMTQEGNVS